ncbi:GAF sensor signal transduction histidine kinase [Calothrix sp. NIES-4101]|nr:GAF sensor signal transduction histidine kinase [Calothrix sp. NIES-4101]
MLSSPNLSFSRTLPTSMFNKLGELLEQMTQAVEGSALVLTEAIVVRVPSSSEWQIQRFTVVVSPGFSALLLGKPREMDMAVLLADEGQLEQTSELANGWENGENDRTINASLTFDLNAIASFLSKLQQLFVSDSQIYRDLGHYSQILAPNNNSLQEKFTLLLLESLLTQSESMTTTEIPVSNSHHSVYKQVETALQKQIAQERLLNQVTTQIRKSLDLSVIMKTAIAQVRDFLKLDRLVIYKFPESKIKNLDTSIAASHASTSITLELSPPKVIDYGGCIIYEVLANDTIPSVLNYQEENCFTPTTKCWQKYSQGFTLAVNDIEKTYALEPCLVQFLQTIKVRAKLVAPIIFENKLWGLLIAHQCHMTRNWHQSEVNLMTGVAEQLAIAIHQSELMFYLTQEKQSLEQRVAERTIALHDALEAAEVARRIRSEFLATISHELKTPLTYVIGMSSTLLRWSFGELTQRQRDYLQTIHDSGEHLLDMIDDILDLSQIEAGKAVLNITEFSLTEIVKKSINELQQKATTQQVELKLDLQLHERRDRFSADVRRVQQILGNLLSNAIKFTPENGTVTLRLWWEESTAVFQVEDTGIGIPEEQLPLLFEKFHQLDTPYRRRYEGTGLGLALTKQLVDMHRGRIEVESTVGMGSIFTVSIPAQPMDNR